MATTYQTDVDVEKDIPLTDVDAEMKQFDAEADDDVRLAHAHNLHQLNRYKEAWKAAGHAPLPYKGTLENDDGTFWTRGPR